MSKRVGIWIRVSTEDQAQGESPQHHELRARAYATAKEWKVVELYDLSGVSGKSVMEHPETQRMLHDVKRGHISGLIFSKLARLARNTKELLDFADIFRDHDAGLISLQEAIDTSTPAGRLFYTMIAAMAEWEREEISSRVAASVPIRAALGKQTGGAAPFGYKWENNQLKIEENEAPIRKHMYDIFLEHKRKRTTARIMNEMGYRTRDGKLFTDTTVDRLLRDPIGKGKRRANYTRSRGDKKHWDIKPEEDWVWIDVEPLISEEVWDQVQATLKASSTGKRIARKPAKHIFSGVTYCECGGVMRVPYNNPKYVCTKCKAKIPVEDLEAIYRSELENFLLSEDHIAEYLHKANDTVKDKMDQLDILLKEQKSIQKKIDKTYQLYLDDKISSDGFGVQCKPLEDRMAQLNEEIPKRQSELDLLKIDNLAAHSVLDQTTDLAQRWDQMSKEDQYGIVEAITESIVIKDKEIAINFHYLPFFINMTTKQRNN
ncbi:MAG: recombinase family protein, partial [Nitrospira sp.]|nr:recombinase family protein [Nitrospira sp.]